MYSWLRNPCTCHACELECEAECRQNAAHSQRDQQRNRGRHLTHHNVGEEHNPYGEKVPPVVHPPRVVQVIDDETEAREDEEARELKSRQIGPDRAAARKVKKAAEGANSTKSGDEKNDKKTKKDKKEKK